MLAELGQGTGRGDLELTANDWAELDIYLYSPVEEAERARLVQDLAMTLRGPADRKLALEALEHMLHADRVVTEEERQVAEEIRQALSRVDLGGFALIGRLVRGALGIAAEGPNREQHLDEFLHNRVLYAVRQRLGRAPDEDLGIPIEEVRKAALAGGLLARVAYVDKEVAQAELARIAASLEQGWGIAPDRALIVAEAAVAESDASLDFYRLTRSLLGQPVSRNGCASSMRCLPSLPPTARSPTRRALRSAGLMPVSI
jgi:uncharacterized tellurite resistance protein B-like protein